MRDKNAPMYSKTAPEPVGAYPHLRQVGNLLILSCTCPRSRGRKQVPVVTLGAYGDGLEYDVELKCIASID